MSSLSVRLPDSLHDKVRELARRDHVSINQFIATAVAEKTSAPADGRLPGATSPPRRPGSLRPPAEPSARCSSGARRRVAGRSAVPAGREPAAALAGEYHPARCGAKSLVSSASLRGNARKIATAPHREPRLCSWYEDGGFDPGRALREGGTTGGARAAVTERGVHRRAPGVRGAPLTGRNHRRHDPGMRPSRHRS